MTRGYVTMLRKSWSPKNRARTIVVLVCVFVFLPLLGLVSSLARTSAEAAVRYYAEAIAQGPGGRALFRIRCADVFGQGCEGASESRFRLFRQRSHSHP